MHEKKRDERKKIRKAESQKLRKENDERGESEEIETSGKKK